jgi:hypothetical protein
VLDSNIILVVAAGIIPMAFVAYTTKPFVTYVHLRLPAFARYSRDLMIRYSKNLPKDAALDITTMNFVGRPKVSRVKVSELYHSQGRFGISNFARDISKIEGKRPWYMSKPIKQFAIRSGAGRTREKGIWENIERGIPKSP